MCCLRQSVSAAFIALSFGLLVSLNGCSTKPSDIWPEKTGPKLLTSFPPIQCFVMNVAGDDATVKVILTSEGAHHGGDPSQHHLKLAATADALFYDGLGLDDGIVAKIKNSAGNSKLSTVALGGKIDAKLLLKWEGDHDEDGHEHGKEHDGHDHEGGLDPHVWLSPKMAKIMVGTIRDELARIDPAHAKGYEVRAAAYIARLDQMHRDGMIILGGSKNRKLLSHHDALGYFARDFDLKIVSQIQIGEVEPGSKELAHIIEEAKKQGVSAIAVEPQFSRNTAAAVIKSELEKSGIHVRYAEVDTLETADEADLTPDFYERKMMQNLENLGKALR
jgi:zinc transport system substrate-binding protein